MINYLDILLNSFNTLSFIRIPVLILLLISLLSILLDTAYRPNIPQYPFNFFLDRLIPISALICPFEAWFTRFTLLLFIHIFLLIPLFYY